MKNFDLRKFIVENREITSSIKEMASFSKLENHEDYLFAMKQLQMLIRDQSTFTEVKKIIDMIGELGLDLGYAEALNDKA